MKQVMLYGAIVTALAVTTPVAMAHEAGDIVIRAGLTYVDPDSESADIF